MGGILKNTIVERTDSEPESISEFRKQVLKNTRLNAGLTSAERARILQQNGIEDDSKHHTVPKDTLQLKKEQELADEKLRWNHENLEANEIAKQQFQDIHVDEPKTPYQGAVDPDGEYYAIDADDDDEDDGGLNGSTQRPAKLDDLDDLSLGAPEIAVSVRKPDSDEVEGISENEDEDPETKHRRFLEKRKEFYNFKNVLKEQPLGEIVDEDDDEDDENQDEE